MPKDDIVYRTEVRFNAIYVIESLPLGDPKTGRDLYDQVIYPATRRLSGIHTQFGSVHTVDELAKRLADVGRAVRRENHLPLIHFEAHGTDHGLMLANGTAVTWRTLVPLLGDINQASRMNLVVIAIACMGLNLVHSLMPSDRAPLFMLVGPRGAMTAEGLLQATSRFYQALVAQLDLNKALEAMNEGLDFDAWPLRPATAEILFCRVFRQYLDEQGTGSFVRGRENSLVAEITRRRKLDLLQSAAVRERVRRDLEDGRSQYNLLRETFLMIDLFPENRSRFGLTFERCMRRSEGSNVASA